DEYLVNRRAPVLVEVEWIEGGCRIGIEQCLTQSIGVDDPAVALHSAIFTITETGFPVPCLKVITKLTQITFEAAGKLVIIRCNLEGPRPGFQRTVSDEGGELSAWARSAKLKRCCSRGRLAKGTYCGSCATSWYACGVGVSAPPFKPGW